MFDQSLQLIPAQSGAVQVPTGSGSGIPWTTIRPSTLDGEVLRVDAPGYIVIYINNNSIGKDVYFDNIRIEHYNGNVLEESHYYPFGLTVSQAASGATAPLNDIKFQSQLQETGLGLNIYGFKWREHDPQIGRFWQVDPLADKYVYNSTYAFSENKVTGHIELEGLEAVDINYTMANGWRELKSNFQNLANAVDAIKFGNEAKVDVKIGSTTYSTSTTKKTSTNFGERLNYIMQYNTNEGLDAPYIKTSSENESSVSFSKDIEVSDVAQVSIYTIVNSLGEKSVGGNADVKTPYGINVGLGGTHNSDNY